MSKGYEAICIKEAEDENMVNADCSTLWEFWDAWRGTKNHAWSGGPLVIMSKHFAGITPLEAGYEKVKIDPQYTLSNSMNCTVPSVKGLITLDYEKVSDNYTINLTLPQDANAVLYVPTDATVNINSQPYYQNGNYGKRSASSRLQYSAWFM